MVGQDRAVEREAHKRGDEQRHPRQPQAFVGHAAEKPQQCRPFQGPAEGDPLPVKLDREDQCHEQQRDPAEPRQHVEAARGVGRQRTQRGRESGQRRHRKQQGDDAHVVVGPRPVHDLVDEEEVHGPRQGRRHPRRELSGKLASKSKRKSGKNRIEADAPGEGDRRAVGGETPPQPDVLKQRRAAEGDERQDAAAQHPREAEQQHAEQQRQPEDRRRIRQWQPQHDHDEQQEGQGARHRRQVLRSVWRDERRSRLTSHRCDHSPSQGVNPGGVKQRAEPAHHQQQ